MVEVAGERTGQSQNVAVLLLCIPANAKQFNHEPTIYKDTKPLMSAAGIYLSQASDPLPRYTLYD
jgi:hypothetical protein